MALNEFTSTENLVMCTPETSIQDIAKQMKDKDVGSVVICENQKPVGIITDRDIVVRCMSEDMDHKSCKASDHMTKSVECVSIDRGIHDVISLMKEKEVRRIIVTDNNGQVCGVVSQGDIINLMAREMGELASGTAPAEEKLVGQEKAAS